MPLTTALLRRNPCPTIFFRFFRVVRGSCLWQRRSFVATVALGSCFAYFVLFAVHAFDNGAPSSQPLSYDIVSLISRCSRFTPVPTALLRRDRMPARLA